MAARRKFTLDTIDNYRVVSDAQIHPDGSNVAFVVHQLTHPRGRNIRANIYLTDSGGENTREFTSADACEMHPRWSPDGKSLAFISDRTRVDDFQIYVIPRVGGEGQKLTQDDPVQPPYRDISMFKW